MTEQRAWVRGLVKTVFMLAVIGVVAAFALILLMLAPFIVAGLMILVLIGAAAVLAFGSVERIKEKLRKEKTDD